MANIDEVDVQTADSQRGGLAVLQFLLVLVLPIVSFPLGEVFGPEWQTDSFTDRVALHLDPDVTRIFAPFIFVAWVAILVTTVAERLVARFRLARYALYSGVVVSAQYFLITLVFTEGAILIPVVVLFGTAGLCLTLYRQHGRSFVVWTIRIVAGLSLFIAILAAVSSLGLGLSAAFFIPSWTVLVLLFSGPAICLTVATHRSVRVWRLAAAVRAPTPTDRLIGSAAGAAWGVGYFAAWQSAAQKAVELYEALPESQPDCYIATAAARGHPGVVRSWTAETTSGSTFAVTSQLQTLKAAELSIRAMSPALHRALRTIYDRLGPVLANRLTSPLRADIAYLTLKPFESLSRVVLRRVLGEAGTVGVYGCLGRPEDRTTHRVKFSCVRKPAKPPCRTAGEWL